MPLLWCLSTSLEGRSASDVVVCSFLVLFVVSFLLLAEAPECLSCGACQPLLRAGWRVRCFFFSRGVCVVFFFVPRRGTRVPSLVVLVNLS